MRAEEFAATHGAAFTQSRPWTAPEIAGLLDQPTVFAMGDARAFALVRVVTDEAELLTIATHPDHQRQGNARALMDTCHATAAERGARRMFLEVAADNSAARGLYTALGYRQVALRKGYYPRDTAPAADALVMARELTLG